MLSTGGTDRTLLTQRHGLKPWCEAKRTGGTGCPPAATLSKKTECGKIYKIQVFDLVWQVLVVFPCPASKLYLLSFGEQF